MKSETVGKTIAYLRSLYGMTQKQLADSLYVTDKAVSRWERGIGAPDISYLTKLSIILDTDIETLLDGNLSRFNLKWKGLLFLNYPELITPDTLLFSKRIVYYQVSFFALAGISDIKIAGKKGDILISQKILGSGEQYGLKISYECFDSTFDKYILSCKEETGTFLIDGLDFLYGKDVTRSFRRAMYHSSSPVLMKNQQKKPTAFRFFPPKSLNENTSYQNVQYSNYFFENGVVSFPIKNTADLLDASNLMQLIKKQNSVKIGDLKEIATVRGMIK